MTPVDLGKVTLSVLTMDVTSQHQTPIHVHITSKNAEVRTFQALKRYGTQISLDMTLEIRPHVKGPSRYGLKLCREGVKLFKESFVMIGRSVRELFSENPKGAVSPPPPVPARFKVGQFL